MDLKDWLQVGTLIVGVVALVATNIWSALQARNTLRQLANSHQQLVATQKANSVTNMWKFSDSWDSLEMKQKRRNAAQALKSAPVTPPNNDVHDVLSFFEKLGYLLHSKAIDLEAAWSMFSAWALPYRQAADDYITRERDRWKDRTVWDEFDYLKKQLLKIESDRTGKSPDEVEGDIKHALSQFLHDEASLAAQGQPPSQPTVTGGYSAGPTFSAWRR